MDWGLIRSKKPESYGLREKTTFPKWMYYQAMVTNLLLRLVWVIFLWDSFSVYDSSGQYDISKRWQIWFCVKLCCELVRRTQWSILRVENEAINNFESYRSIYVVPPLAQETKVSDIVRLKRILD
jgi:hypothetical protein